MSAGAGANDGPAAPDLLGRAEACALIDALLGESRPWPVLAFGGEAGIGKSRLAEVAAALARGRGMRVLEGRASARDAALPLGAFRDALRGALRDGESVEVVADPLGAAFPGWLLPELADAETGPVELDVLFEAAVRYVHGLSGSGGLLLVLEDVHHAAPFNLLSHPSPGARLPGGRGRGPGHVPARGAEPPDGRAAPRAGA